MPEHIVRYNVHLTPTTHEKRTDSEAYDTNA